MSEAIRIVAIPANGRSPFETVAQSQVSSAALGNCGSAGTGYEVPGRMPMVANGGMVWSGAPGSQPAPYVGNITSGEDWGPVPDRTAMVAGGGGVWSSASGAPFPTPCAGNLTSGDDDWGPGGYPAQHPYYAASAAAAVAIMKVLWREPAEPLHISITAVGPKSEPAPCVPTLLPCDPVPVETAAVDARPARGGKPTLFPPLPAAALRETPVPSFTGLHAPGGWKQFLD